MAGIVLSRFVPVLGSLAKQEKEVGVASSYLAKILGPNLKNWIDLSS
jgi:hypothetical protein